MTRFNRLYDQILYWIGFRANPSDEKLRAKEETFLLGILSSAPTTLSIELLQVIKPEDQLWDIGDGQVVDAMRVALRGKCLALVAPNAAREAISFVTREGAIRSLIEKDRFSSVRYCLFHPASLVWKGDLRNELLESIRKGQKEFAVYVNIRDYFKLLSQGLKRGIDSITQQEIATLLRDEEFVRCLWDAVTSRSIQYRMRIAFVRDRESLIRNGASASALPLTRELRERLDEELQAQGQGLASSQGAEATAIIEPDA